MIPRWQWVTLIVLIFGVIALDLVFFPHSYAHATLWGECGKADEPQECHPRGRSFRTGGFHSVSP